MGSSGWRIWSAWAMQERNTWNFFLCPWKGVEIQQFRIQWRSSGICHLSTSIFPFPWSMAANGGFVYTPKNSWKMMIGRRSFPFGMVPFQGHVNFQGKAVLRSSIQCFIAFAALGLQSQCQLGSWWCWPYSSSTPERVGILAQHTIV